MRCVCNKKRLRMAMLTPSPAGSITVVPKPHFPTYVAYEEIYHTMQENAIVIEFLMLAFDSTHDLRPRRHCRLARQTPSILRVRISARDITQTHDFGRAVWYRVAASDRDGSERCKRRPFMWSMTPMLVTSGSRRPLTLTSQLSSGLQSVG